MFSPTEAGKQIYGSPSAGFRSGYFSFRDRGFVPPAFWRSVPANLLTFCNMGSGALVAWWAASEFDLGWAAAEWPLPSAWTEP